MPDDPMKEALQEGDERAVKNLPTVKDSWDREYTKSKSKLSRDYDQRLAKTQARQITRYRAKRAAGR